MGCQLSKNKPNNSVKVNVSSPIVFTKHKDITQWERNDYTKRSKKKEVNDSITYSLTL